jgi:hypothetical protein
MSAATETVTRKVPYRLTEEERLLRSDELAIATREMYEAEAHRKAVAKELKGKVDELQEKVKELSAIVEEKTELRPTECQWARDDGRKTMVLLRVDTGEVIETRPMTEDELALRQVDLFDSGASKRGGRGPKAPRSTDA